jgi:hypothetical protein
VVPEAGRRVEVVTIARRDAAWVMRVDGRSVWVRVEGHEDEQRFEAHPMTGHFVRHGEPYWGARLALGESDVS